MKSELEQGAAVKLSPRQEQCLRGVLDLKSAKQIARDLGISPHAVEKHLRASREKLGVATSAEAARAFASGQGSEIPYYGVSGLVADRVREHQEGVLEPPGRPSLAGLESAPGALTLDTQLSPRQTLLTIAAVSLGSIVGLLLLVACAEAIRSLVSG